MPEPSSVYAGHRTKAFWRLRKLVEDPTIEFIVDKSFPGSGKTHRNIELIKSESEKKFLILAEAHTILDLYERLLPSSEVIHWKGFERSCQHLDVFRGFPPRIACSICKERFPNTYANCPYHQAFKEDKRVVLAPLAYLQTKQLERLEPDVIIVEESLFNGKVIEPPDPKVMHLHSIALGRDLTEDDYINHCEELTVELQRKLLENLYHAPDLDFVREAVRDLFAQSPCEIGLYLRYARSQQVPNSLDKVVIPYALLLFEYARKKGAKVINTDASFNEAVWEYLKQRATIDPVYNMDLPNPEIIEIPVHESSKSSVVVRVVPKKIPQAKYTKQTLANENIPSLEGIAKKIVKIVEYLYPQFVIDNRGIVPIITYKQFEDRLGILIQRGLEKHGYHDLTVRTMHFGSSLRSSRDFEGLKFLFIVGTFTVGPDAFREILLSYFLIDPDTIGIQSYRDKDSRWKYSSQALPDIDEIRKYWEDETQLQAIFRIRPFSEDTITFLFGLPPERLEHMLSIKTLDDIKKVKRYPKTLATLKLAIKRAEEFIQNYEDEHVPFSEVMAYLESLGFHYQIQRKVVESLSHQYAIYTEKTGKRGRPKKYFVNSHW
ncbi:hypothetical protein [Thermococcus atlanticus]